MTLTEELKAFLRQQGAALVGIADLTGVENCSYPRGIVVAVPLPKSVILDLQHAPTEEYHQLYHSLNAKLNEIVLAGEEFLKSKGYDAWAQTTDRVQINEQNVSPLPHKTVAVRAGLGWIGKNCLLITEAFGSAVRISTLLTDAPLDCGEAITASRCGDCRLCVESCPAQALKGTLWQAGMERAEIVDVCKCDETMRRRMREATGREANICGKCFAVCQYTRKYLDAKD